MTGGAELSARERAWVRVRLGWAAGPRDAGERASASVGASARAGRSVGPSWRKEGGVGPS
jgi:hypothetical protein